MSLIIKDATALSVFSAKKLTATYAAGSTVNTSEYNRAVVCLTYTKGSSTALQLKVEVSPDGTNFYTYDASDVDAVSGSTISKYNTHWHFATSGAQAFCVDIEPLGALAKYLKISAKVSGGVTTTAAVTLAIYGSVKGRPRAQDSTA